MCYNSYMSLLANSALPNEEFISFWFSYQILWLHKMKALLKYVIFINIQPDTITNLFPFWFLYKKPPHMLQKEWKFHSYKW